MTRESSLWDWLRRGSRTEAGLHMTRVENAVGEGTPDIEGCLRGRQFWIELKCADRPARKTTPVRFKMRRAQTDWLERRAVVGGRAWLLLQVGSGAEARKYLLPGTYARRIAEGMTEECIDFESLVNPHEGADYFVCRAAEDY